MLLQLHSLAAEAQASGNGVLTEKPSHGLLAYFCRRQQVSPFPDLTLAEQIGSGAFSSVSRAVSQDSGESFAVKRITIDSPKDLAAAQEEYRLNRRLAPRMKHNELVRVHSACEDADAHEYKIVFDYCEGGSLDQQLWRGSPLREQDVKLAMFNVFRALAAMHKEKVAHCDIKLANIMMMKRGDFSSVCLADLGLSHDLRKSVWITTMAGTPKYFAPEVVRNYYQGTGYNQQVDVWAAGVCMYELLCGEAPFDSPDFGSVLRKIVRTNVGFSHPAFASVSEDAIDLMKGAMCKDKDKRLTAKQALHHAWFRDLEDKPARARLFALHA